MMPLIDAAPELCGDFEDLETGDVHKGKSGPDTQIEDVEEEIKEEIDSNTEESAKKKHLEKKRKLKEMFDAEYDEGESTYFDDLKREMQKQAQLNWAEFEDQDEARVQYEGFRPGMYVRIEIENVPCEFVLNFDPHYPIILGGLGNSKGNVGYAQMHLKKHCWFKKILKSRDPVIFSVGWRRFQTIPLYSVEDHNGRQRLLKYTPQHMHCGATFWDIVFMRTWYPVSIPAFYNPVTSLLKPIGEKDTWSGMRTTGQLRLAHGVKFKPNKDSLYKKMKKAKEQWPLQSKEHFKVKQKEEEEKLK
ncbi:hypothetical protein MC885_015920 [Smutsia gigantea]|nr:hypothetical protein MC885_015920 [Smutsia gigantea]